MRAMMTTSEDAMKKPMPLEMLILSTVPITNSQT